MTWCIHHIYYIVLLSMQSFLLGDVVYVMWKPWSETLKSEWKWIHAAGPVVCRGAGVAVLQYFPKTGSSGRRPSRIYNIWPHKTNRRTIAKHLKWDKDNAVTLSRSIFDQYCLVWEFDLSVVISLCSGATFLFFNFIK